MKLDDTFFKDKIDYNNLEDNIYTQLAKTMAKNIDIDLAKTPLVDILTGYTRYRILQSKIDKAIEYVSKLSSKGRDCEIYYDIKKEILHILKEDK